MDNAAQIREVATELFASLGYEGASLQAIAERVGVTKQTLLYHYPSKEALRRAVLDQVFVHWRERLPQMLAAVTSGHGRFEALTRELIRFFEHDPDRARLIVRELLDNPAEMERMLRDNLRPWILLVAQYVREGQRVGMIYQDTDPEAYVLHVIASVLCAMAARPIFARVLADDEDVARAGRRARDELLRITRTALFTPEHSSQPTKETQET